jgi:hypothetical protein
LVDPVDAALDAINADKTPDDPPAVRDPCGECADLDCENCPIKDGTPIKLYDPKEAVIAMLAGRILRNEKMEKFFWKDNGFHYEGKAGKGWMDFSGLYEEAKYV